jgi:hypothetical protein
MGIPTLIKTLTADGDSALSFVDGASSVVFDSTYDEYMFVCTDINPATNGADFKWQVNATDDAGGGYDTSQFTSTFSDAQHSEDDGTAVIGYRTDFDQANGADFQWIDQGTGNGSDESSVSILHIFSPASTTYVKHFYSRAHHLRSDDRANSYFVAGYINDTTAIDEIQFKMSSGNFDGVIQMYGIS